MHVELEQTVDKSFKMVLVSNPTLCRITVTMLLTAISRRRVKHPEAVILQALLPLVPIPLRVSPCTFLPNFYFWVLGLIFIPSLIDLQM